MDKSQMLKNEQFAIATISYDNTAISEETTLVTLAQAVDVQMEKDVHISEVGFIS